MAKWHTEEKSSWCNKFATKNVTWLPNVVNGKIQLKKGRIARFTQRGVILEVGVGERGAGCFRNSLIFASLQDGSELEVTFLPAPSPFPLLFSMSLFFLHPQRTYTPSRFRLFNALRDSAITYSHSFNSSLSLSVSLLRWTQSCSAPATSTASTSFPRLCGRLRAMCASSFCTHFIRSMVSAHRLVVVVVVATLYVGALALSAATGSLSLSLSLSLPHTLTVDFTCFTGAGLCFVGFSRPTSGAVPGCSELVAR